MAGNEPHNMLTAMPKTYTTKEALREVKRQQSLPLHQQSKWYEVKSGNRVYFTGVK
jgi:hypothetical protein